MERLQQLDRIYGDPDAVRAAVRALADFTDQAGNLVRVSDDAVEGAVKFVARAGTDIPPDVRETLLREVIVGNAAEAEKMLLFFRDAPDTESITGFAQYLLAVICPAGQ